ncbi:MAG TPA: hypothetical protein VFU07_05005 [Candidatus Lumbricidophila sp.]|nr:hypothetical protein [Candidatus Lumbricidophila sp.]
MKQIPWESNIGARERAERLFNELDLGSVKSAFELTQRVAEVVGKPVRIEKHDNLVLSATTALTVDFPDYAAVLLRAGDKFYYQLRALHHEFGHLLFGHPGCPGELIDSELRGMFAGGRVYGRMLLTEHESSPLLSEHEHEAEAEAMADLLTRALLRPEYLNDERVFG